MHAHTCMLHGYMFNAAKRGRAHVWYGMCVLLMKQYNIFLFAFVKELFLHIYLHIYVCVLETFISFFVSSLPEP